jgi:hypothetical protein
MKRRAGSFTDPKALDAKRDAVALALVLVLESVE